MLIDKSYYDYDFNEDAAEKYKRKTEALSSDKPKSKQKVQSILERFGFKTKITETESKHPLTPEEAQRVVMSELRGKSSQRLRAHSGNGVESSESGSNE